MTIKRAAIFDPYLDTAGGGERYVLTFAAALKKLGWDVELQWREPKILKWLELRLGIDLSGIEVVPDISKGAGYDLCFWLSDGSVPLLFSGKNIIHFQTPFKGVGGKSVLNRLKFLKIGEIVCNSNFTKAVIDKEYGVTSKVLYPPVSVEQIKPGKKENIILSVGRFSQLQQAKRQDVLVDAFRKMCKNGLSGWELVLIGGSDVGGEGFVKSLKTESRGFPIKILANLSFDEVKKYYSHAKIFWSAAGFNIDEVQTPQKVEHFGISVVEGMAAGAVPVAANRGGHKEIINSKALGFLWESPHELQEVTRELIKNERRREEIAEKAKKRAQVFSVERFEKEVAKFAG